MHCAKHLAQVWTVVAVAGVISFDVENGEVGSGCERK